MRINLRVNIYLFFPFLLLSNFSDYRLSEAVSPTVLIQSICMQKACFFFKVKACIIDYFVRQSQEMVSSINKTRSLILA